MRIPGGKSCCASQNVIPTAMERTYALDNRGSGAGMSRKTRKPQAKAIVKGATTNSPAPAGFDEVLALIEATRSRVVTAVNTALIDLYWRIGQYISRKIADEGWGQGTVAALAEYIRARRPNARGFSASNLWRMMQFYGTYRGLPKLAPLVRVLSWTHNLLIMSRSKRDEEREFYLRLCVQGTVE